MSVTSSAHANPSDLNSAEGSITREGQSFVSTEVVEQSSMPLDRGEVAGETLVNSSNSLSLPETSVVDGTPIMAVGDNLALVSEGGYDLLPEADLGCEDPVRSVTNSAPKRSREDEADEEREAEMSAPTSDIPSDWEGEPSASGDSDMDDDFRRGDINQDGILVDGHSGAGHSDASDCDPLNEGATNAHPANGDHTDNAKSIASTSTFSVIEGSMSVGSLHPAEVLGYVLSQERTRMGSATEKSEETSNEGQSPTQQRCRAEVIAVDGAKELLSRFDRALTIATRHSSTHLMTPITAKFAKPIAAGSTLDVAGIDFTRIMKDKLRGMAEWMMASYPFPEVENLKRLPKVASVGGPGGTGDPPVTQSLAVAKRQQWFVESDRWLTSVLAVLIDPLGQQFGFNWNTARKIQFLVPRGRQMVQLERFDSTRAESPAGEPLAAYWDRIFILTIRAAGLGLNPFITGSVPLFDKKHLNKSDKLQGLHLIAKSYRAARNSANYTKSATTTQAVLATARKQYMQANQNRK